MKYMLVVLFFLQALSVLSSANEVCEKEKNTVKFGIIIIVIKVLQRMVIKIKKQIKLKFIKVGLFHNM